MTDEAAITVQIDEVTESDIGLTIWKKIDDGSLAECEIVAVRSQQIRVILPDGREVPIPKNRIEFV